MLGMLAGAALRSLLLAAVVGAALQLRRTYNPRVSLVAWTLVLAASLAMPMATRLASIALPHAMIQVATLPLTQDFVTQPDVASVMSRVEQGLSAALAMAAGWSWLALSLYLAVFSVLMLRLIVGLALSWRFVRRAAPIREDWVGGLDVRVSRHIDAPATFGSVILLPGDYTGWTTAKRLAVLAHEGSHVGRHDSAIQLAAAVNRMVFWFNPFAWWLQRHLSDLAEAASDDAAIAGLGDRVGYAEILLEVSGRVPSLPGAVAMAHRSVVALRIERILSDAPLPAGVGRRGRAMMAGCIVPFAISLSCVVVSRAPPLVTEVPSAANAGGDKAAATDARSLAPVYSVAAVMPEIAVPPPVSTAPAKASVATGLPPTREPETPSSPRTPTPVTARPSAPPLPSSAPGPSRRAPHPANATVVTGRTSRMAVYPVKTLSHAAAIAPDPLPKGAGEDDQPPLFDTLVNATCGVTDLLRLGPAFLIPRGDPSYLARAHFFRSRDGRPWVTLYYTGGQAANLPVTIKATEIEFVRSYDLIYTLSSSHGNHLVSFAKHPNGGSVDFACRGENAHPS